MKIKIIDDSCEGDFTVGDIYNVSSLHGMFVYAVDDNGSIEAVYTYQYEVVS